MTADMTRSGPTTVSTVTSAEHGGLVRVWLNDSTSPSYPNVRLLTEAAGARAAACAALAKVVEEHFVGGDVLARMGFPVAAKTLAERLPRKTRIRSGDLAEVIATEFVQECTEFVVPLKRLRHKDDREMSMRGDDIIGLHATAGEPAVLKAEVKSRAALTTTVVGEACTALDARRGRPKSETLAFLSTHLRYANRDSEAERIEDLQTNRLGAKDIAHLVFTMSGNDPAGSLEAHAATRRLINDRRLVGLRVTDHQNFIASIFDGVMAVRESMATPVVTVASATTSPADPAALRGAAVLPHTKANIAPGT